jgi:hypothetical protein
MLLSQPYQGNAWWVFFGLFSLTLLGYVLSSARSRRNVGLPLDTRGIVVACIFFLGFVAVSIYQLLTHQ